MSARGTNSEKKLPFYGAKEGSDVGVLLNSKVAVEKKNYVSTGMITYVAGDVIEVEMPQSHAFELGEKVKLIVYTSIGLFVFESSVVAKDTGALIIINPPENKRRFNEKRQHPRIAVQHPGKLNAILHGIHPRAAMSEPVEVTTVNISLGGVGVSIATTVDIQTDSRLELELDLGFPFVCTTEVVRMETTKGGIFYGTRYLELSAEKASALRAFILRNQVEDYYKEKKQRLLEQASCEAEAARPASRDSLQGELTGGMA
ncbi:PilZ domain-containing protein [Paenibacillus sp. IB182496]|uniref:PilZ domain-containing protein n=1 Tax=Paenibacillus sabuli TaxID=2772509 RepID=A0A927BTY8_9BACL|nr:PilZ domain-containing protein [Paenibacillus sabuli]MBD2845479.1 PilZ domain-containing protein [Paenibacillus sabuli]